MIKTGDIIENPITSEKMEFLQTAEDTNGALLQVALLVKPGGFVAAPHIHPVQEERFFLNSGTIRLQVDGSEQLLSAGQEGVIPPGTPHVWWNAGQDNLEAIVEFRPALRTQDVLSTIFALARDGLTDAKGVPNLLQIAVMKRKYWDDMYLAKPPIAVQKLLFLSITWIGRLLGYHPDYPFCSETREAVMRASEIKLGLVKTDRVDC
jgi:quercetin dioxygenase-like cupin family protein